MDASSVFLHPCLLLCPQIHDSSFCTPANFSVHRCIIRLSVPLPTSPPTDASSVFLHPCLLLCPQIHHSSFCIPAYLTAHRCIILLSAPLPTSPPTDASSVFLHPPTSLPTDTSFFFLHPCIPHCPQMHYSSFCTLPTSLPTDALFFFLHPCLLLCQHHSSLWIFTTFLFTDGITLPSAFLLSLYSFIKHYTIIILCQP